MASVTMEGYLLHLIHKTQQSRNDLNKKKTMSMEVRSLEFWRAIIAECLATFIYVFLVCGSHVMWPMYSVNTLTKSFANGLAMATATQCFGHISGAHVNPAFTLSMLVTQKVTPLRAFLYITSQCGGAIAGAALLYGVTVSGVGFRENTGCTLVSDTLTPYQGLALETMLTFVVSFTMCASADPERKTLGNEALSIGLAYLVCTLIALPATGASMNPARSLGPAFVSNTWTNHWIYWAGPILGSLLAALIYEYIFDSPPKKGTSSVRDKEESERDISEPKDDSDSKSSAAMPPRTPQPQNIPTPVGSYYRPLTPHEGTANYRPHSRNTFTQAKYAQSPSSSQQQQQHQQQQQQQPHHQPQHSQYYNSLPRGGNSGYRSWNDYGNVSQFKF